MKNMHPVTSEDQSHCTRLYTVTQLLIDLSEERMALNALPAKQKSCIHFAHRNDLSFAKKYNLMECSKMARYIKRETETETERERERECVCVCV